MKEKNGLRKNILQVSVFKNKLEYYFYCFYSWHLILLTFDRIIPSTFKKILWSWCHFRVSVTWTFNTEPRSRSDSFASRRRFTRRRSLNRRGSSSAADTSSGVWSGTSKLSLYYRLKEITQTPGPFISITYIISGISTGGDFPPSPAGRSATWTSPGMIGGEAAVRNKRQRNVKNQRRLHRGRRGLKSRGTVCKKKKAEEGWRDVLHLSGASGMSARRGGRRDDETIRSVQHVTGRFNLGIRTIKQIPRAVRFEHIRQFCQSSTWFRSHRTFLFKTRQRL